VRDNIIRKYYGDDIKILLLILDARSLAGVQAVAGLIGYFDPLEASDLSGDEALQAYPADTSGRVDIRIQD